MRIERRWVCLLAILAATVFASGAGAQNPDTLDPDTSAAKGKQVLSKMTEAMGGQKFLQAKGAACEGKRAVFGHNGDMTGYIEFKSYWAYPDRFRIDYAKKGNIVDLYIGEQGWTLDRGGVSEEPVTAVAEFLDSVRRDLNNLLRRRIHEDKMLIRWGGNSVVDLHEVEWVELTDAEERTYRVAMDRSTHLPARLEVVTRDEETRERRQEITRYTNFQPQEGVELPMQVSRERDGRRVYQAFYESCRINPDLPADFFTKEALEKRFKDVGGKSKK